MVKRQNLSAELLDAAIVCLARARQSKQDNDPDLTLRKGELLLAAGQQTQGVSALRESMALRPTLRAFQALGKIYAAEKKTEDLVALCKRTLPAMKSDESRYAVLDSCLEFSGATAPEAGIGWASPKDLSFYKARRREVEARQSAAKHEKERNGAPPESTAGR